jgi:hypothetical protein
VCARSMVGASVAGLRALGATSPFDGVTVGLGVVRTGCEGVTRLAGRCGARLGLAKGNGGLLDLLGYLFALGSTSKTGKCESFALGAMLSVIGLAVCL